MLGNLETSDNVTENHIIDKHYVVQMAFPLFNSYAHTNTHK